MHYLFFVFFVGGGGDRGHYGPLEGQCRFHRPIMSFVLCLKLNADLNTSTIQFETLLFNSKHV